MVKMLRRSAGWSCVVAIARFQAKSREIDARRAAISAEIAALNIEASMLDDMKSEVVLAIERERRRSVPARSGARSASNAPTREERSPDPVPGRQVQVVAPNYVYDESLQAWVRAPFRRNHKVFQFGSDWDAYEDPLVAGCIRLFGWLGLFHISGVAEAQQDVFTPDLKLLPPAGAGLALQPSLGFRLFSLAAFQLMEDATKGPVYIGMIQAVIDAERPLSD